MTQEQGKRLPQGISTMEDAFRKAYGTITGAQVSLVLDVMGYVAKDTPEGPNFPGKVRPFSAEKVRAVLHRFDFNNLVLAIEVVYPLHEHSLHALSFRHRETFDGVVFANDFLVPAHLLRYAVVNDPLQSFIRAIASGELTEADFVERTA